MVPVHLTGPSRRTAAVAAVAVLACGVLAACGESDSSAGDGPTSTSTSSSGTSSSTAVVPDLDVAALASSTSTAGPVRFTTDLVVDDPDTPVSRVEGLVDWAGERGQATEWVDPGLYQGQPSQGLHKVALEWATSASVVEQGLGEDGAVDGDPQVVDGTVLGLVGWSDAAATASGSAGVEQIILSLVGGRAFGPGEADAVEGGDAVHYAASGGDGSGVTDVWVSDQGLLVRLVLATSEAGSPVRQVITLTDYGTDNEIEPPPALGGGS